MAFTINIRFLGGLTESQENIFQAAARRWAEVIVGDVPRVRVGDEIIDGILITAQGMEIDGENMILGQAAPDRLRARSFLPATGFMEFDTADLAALERDGQLKDVILHEMGHVLGIGTIWRQKGLLFRAGTANPRFLGPNASHEFAALLGSGSATRVPVANENGPGTRDSHWRESVFGNELMTGFLSGSVRPLSRLTVASLADLGYQVNYDAADAYALPTSLQLAIMGVGASEIVCMRCGAMHGRSRRPAPEAVLPEAMID
jgi:hypothetical protein